MRFVAVKTEDQQAVLMLHKARELLVRQRTTVSGADLPRDVVTLEAGLGLALAERSDFSIGYAGHFGDGPQRRPAKMSLAALLLRRSSMDQREQDVALA